MGIEVIKEWVIFPGSTDCKARPKVVSDPANDGNFDKMIRFGAVRALSDGPEEKHFYLCNKLTNEQVEGSWFRLVNQTDFKFGG